MIMLNKQPQIFDVSNKALGRLGYMYHLAVFCFKLRLIRSDLIAKNKIMYIKSVSVGIKADIGGYLFGPAYAQLGSNYQNLYSVLLHNVTSLSPISLQISVKQPHCIFQS